MADWEIGKRTGKCFVSEQQFGEGDFYYAALFETEGGFERRDYAESFWEGPPEGCFCYWRGRVPIREKDKGPIRVDTGLLTQLFLRLEDTDSESKQHLRFVLALLLMRKRVLRFDRAEAEDDREFWHMTLMADRSSQRVLNPRLEGDHIERLQSQLSLLLSGEVAAVDALQRDDDSAEADEQEASPGEICTEAEVRESDRGVSAVSDTPSLVDDEAREADRQGGEEEGAGGQEEASAESANDV